MITVTNIGTFHDHFAHYEKVVFGVVGAVRVVGVVAVAGVVSVVCVVCVVCPAVKEKLILSEK